MGYSAKITRGGNKKRVNQGRLDAKLKAQGAKSHSLSVKESVDAKKALKKQSKAIAGELKAKAAQTHTGSGPVIRMTPRVKPTTTESATPK